MNTSSHFEVKQSVTTGTKDLPAPVQQRSKATAGRFVDAALDLLQDKTFAELSVAELAAKAERSVGVFYQRFGSKDDFLAVLLSAYFAESLKWREHHSTDGVASEVYARILTRGYQNIVSHRNLWHAALERSAADPSFWGTYQGFRQKAAELTLEAVEKASGRQLDPAERRRLAIAGQVFNSVINNQIINGPGPLELDDAGFLPEMLEIVLDIAPFAVAD